MYVRFTRFILALAVAFTGCVLLTAQVPANGALPAKTATVATGTAKPNSYPGAHPYAYKPCKNKVRNYAMGMQRGNPNGLEFFWLNDFIIFTHEIWVRTVVQAIYVNCPRKGPDKVMFAKFEECQYFEGYEDHKHWIDTQVNLIVERQDPHKVMNNPPAHDITDNGEVQSCTHQYIAPQNRHWISQASIPTVEGDAVVHLAGLKDQSARFTKHRPSINRDFPASGKYRQHPPRL